MNFDTKKINTTCTGTLFLLRRNVPTPESSQSDPLHFFLPLSHPSDRETSARQLSQSESQVGIGGGVGQREMQPGGLQQRQGAAG